MSQAQDEDRAYRYALWAAMSGADWQVVPGNGAPIVDLAAQRHRTGRDMSGPREWRNPLDGARILRGSPLGGAYIPAGTVLPLDYPDPLDAEAGPLPVPPSTPAANAPIVGARAALAARTRATSSRGTLSAPRSPSMLTPVGGLAFGAHSPGSVPLGERIVARSAAVDRALSSALPAQRAASPRGDTPGHSSSGHGRTPKKHHLTGAPLTVGRGGGGHGGGHGHQRGGGRHAHRGGGHFHSPGMAHPVTPLGGHAPMPPFVPAAPFHAAPPASPTHGPLSPHGGPHGPHGHHHHHGWWGGGPFPWGGGAWGPWWDGAAWVCPDGYELATLDDGVTVCVPIGALPSEYAAIQSQVPAYAVGARVGQDTTSTSAFPPANTGSLLGPAAGATGTNPTDNAIADSINLQMQAVASVIGQCGGSTVTLPTQYQPNFTNSTWTQDYSNWQTFYQDISQGSLTLATITGDTTGWQAQANAWGSYIRATCPTLKLPPNFPMGSAGLASIVPSFGTIGWVLAVGAIALAAWFFWPKLVGARGLL
jgi:hypothetical protein